ncbi:enoyl-CoA hydratase-related protein [Hirschia baltica]|uniref:Enoyl-CoA hydratase/isomerase n=1 Tax=Hirschia baltica (strain ATCC 49814 / DSM 5838 / IFAM 1418) TaxID=582402 RepID=C6XL99_HIRBI|nr:enoyl-CoA hydratase-related protein [Hirschia baltica]ACT59698.1 Enoyl-CoA hydratase/isomerase [Hirschia baltica ATCC 49814]
MSTYEHIELDVSRLGVAVILINRPEQHNAFNSLVVEELSDAIDLVSKTVEVRFVIFRGAGDVFSVGGDKEWTKAAIDYTEKENEEDALAMANMLRKLYEMPQLTLAMVHGDARGGGVGIVAACDIAIASKNVGFSFPDVARGILPATIAPFVVEAIGPRWAKALFLTGETFDGDFAEQIGLVQYAVEDEAEMENLAEYMASLAFKAGPSALANTKALISHVLEEPIDSSLMHSVARLSAKQRASAEGIEGLTAAVEDRSPSWAKSEDE